MFVSLMFIVLAGLAVGSAIAVVVQRNPLYCAISLVGVFISLSGLYLLLAAPFIAAVQVIVYAGAIMVLVIFVIMLLNVEEEVKRPLRRIYLIPAAVLFSGALLAQTLFIINAVQRSSFHPATATESNVGSVLNIGVGLFTEYLLPFELAGVLLLMAIVGATSVAKQVTMQRQTTEDDAEGAISGILPSEDRMPPKREQAAYGGD
jgi:NADH-quinone oxidoreductase subunit J